VRDDLLRADVCKQIALALRDEVADLETAGPLLTRHVRRIMPAAIVHNSLP
jgi:hypothetical protein